MSVLWLLAGIVIGVWAQATFNLWARAVALWRRFQAWRRFRDTDDRYPPEGQ